jgi:hypothetical protein
MFSAVSFSVRGHGNLVCKAMHNGRLARKEPGYRYTVTIAAWGRFMKLRTFGYIQGCWNVCVD